MLFIRGLTESGVAILADGTLSRVIEVEPVDLAMKDPAERERLYAWYADWIRHLRHPTAVQIVIASSPQDISPWLARLRRRQAAWEAAAGQAGRECSGPAAGHPPAGRLADALGRQIAFIEEAHARIRPLVARYYVVVFLNPFPLRTSGRRSTIDPETFQKAEAELDRRTARVAEGLARVVEAPVRVLDAHQVAAVVGGFYHRTPSPDVSTGEPYPHLAPSLACGLLPVRPEVGPGPGQGGPGGAAPTGSPPPDGAAWPPSEVWPDTVPSGARHTSPAHDRPAGVGPGLGGSWAEPAGGPPEGGSSQPELGGNQP
jgi:hypothetical protein